MRVKLLRLRIMLPRAIKRLVAIIPYHVGTWKSLHVKRILIFSTALILVCSYFGVFVHPFEKNYHYYFQYPLEGDIDKYTSQLLSGRKPDVSPINQYVYPFIIPNQEKCILTEERNERIRVLLIIKSSVKNFVQRSAIRQSWGWEQRFSDVIIRRVFNLGSLLDDSITQRKVFEEHQKNGDIIQSQFIDSYFNNTIKTMMGFRWAIENCANAEFVMFVDDDMYVSVKNVLRFLRYPQEYPTYLEQNIMHPVQRSQFKFDLNEAPADFFAGYVFFSAPLRHMSSKWYISLTEYPFHMFPPYVTAGAFIMPFRTLKKMYYTSMYTKHFRFDDVFLGLVAKKAGINPFHNENFYFWKKAYSPHDYQFVIASHGYENPKELLDVWTEQRTLGYA